MSQDGGSTWARAAGATTAALERPGENQLTSVTHGAAGWLAVGGAMASDGPGAGGPPVVVGSADGKTWTEADGETAFAGTGLVTSATAAGSAGYVVVGRQVSGGQTVAAAWYSRGLTGWQRAADARAGALEAGGNSQMTAVTATPDGFVAVGAAGTHPAAWLSASGRTWSAVALPLPPGAKRAELEYVAANGKMVAAEGTATTADGRDMPFAAVSANGGATWSQAFLPVPDGDTATVTALTAAGSGFTAAGTYGQPGGQDVILWLLSAGTGSAGGSAGTGSAGTGSAGGTSSASQSGAASRAPATVWTASTPSSTGLAGPGAQAITALTGSGATLTGAGFTATATAEEPTLWQSPVRN
jgi:hypothetical protein